MDKFSQTEKSKKTKSIIIRFFASLFILMVTSVYLIPKFTNAAETSVSIKEINYKNSTITLQVNSGDTEIYFSDSTKKTWEAVPGEIESNKTITMDISWIPITKNYILTFKGNQSTGILSVTLPKQLTNFKASFNKLNGTVAFTNAGIYSIEWRKKDSTSWSIVNSNQLKTELSYLYTNGATIYFRIAPINGTSSVEVGCRASKEVAIIIPKKANAPVITVNGSNFSIPVKKGMAYRLMNSNGTTSEWITINSASTLFLKDIAPSVLYTGGASVQKEVILQFRTDATSKAQISNISTFTLPVQEGIPNVNTYGISMNYTSSSSLSLQIKAASSTSPFEYTIMKEGDELNYQSTKWTAITSGALINLKSTAAPNGSHIYVRRKSTVATASTSFTLASVELDVTGSNGVNYPEAAKVNAVTTLITTAGVCQEGKSTSYLTFALYSPTSSTVAAVNFLDAYGNDKGTVSIKSTVALNSASTGSFDKYIITTKITSTSTVDTITEQLLFANITLANSDTIISTATNGVLLYLYPNTITNNPNEVNYSENFKRIYLSTYNEDTASFKFKLEFGTEKVIDTTAINKYTSTATAVSSIKYSGYTLYEGTDYTVEYGSYLDSSKKTIATATVTVNTSKFENSAFITNTDQALPLIVNLNNGEILDNNIYVTLINTAKIDNTPIAWSITEGSLKESKSTTVTNTDGTSSIVTEELITYTITLTLFDTSYGVSVSNVTWGGVSVFGSATVAKGKATIYLSNAKINKLTTNSTDTQSIVITLSNGFVIKSGCKLTIMNASN